MYRLAVSYVVIFTLFSFRLVEEPETVLLIEMERTGMVVGIHHKETAASLVVLISEPVFENFQNLSSNKSAAALKMFVNTKASDEYSRITAPAFRVADASVESVGGGAPKVGGFDAVVGEGEKTHDAVRNRFGYPAVSLSQQFLLIEKRVILEEIVESLLHFALAARKRSASTHHLLCKRGHRTFFCKNKCWFFHD